MHIGIIGCGNMGGGLGRIWAMKGHTVMFSYSRSAQLVDRLDRGRFGERVLGYADLWDGIRNALDKTHAEGRLKAEIVEAPGAYVDLDPELAPALIDLRDSGKRLLLITNSEWPYTKAMMSFALDRFLPPGVSWRSLFDLVIVAARKPEFFSARLPLFEIASDDGLLRPCVAGPAGPGAYLGGDAALVETVPRAVGIGDPVYWRPFEYRRAHQQGHEEVAPAAVRVQPAFRQRRQPLPSSLEPPPRRRHVHSRQSRESDLPCCEDAGSSRFRPSQAEVRRREDSADR